MSFEDLSLRGYTSELLPIIPPGAKISSFSRAPDALRNKTGKIPGKLVSDGWVGFADWTKLAATGERLHVWASWGAGVGVQTRHLPAVDIDVDDPELAARIAAAVVDTIGHTPRREGRDGRCLLVYRAAKGFSPAKRTVTWFAGQEKQAVELLGDGQQFVAEGIHPKTNKPYRWSEPLPPRAALVEVDAAAWDRVVAAVEMVVELAGYEPLSGGSAGRTDDLDQDDLRAPALAAVRAALDAVDPKTLDYDEWIKASVAVKAAGGDEAQELWTEWTLRAGLGDAEGAAAKWRSFKPPFSTGWPWLSQWASSINPKAFNAAAYDFSDISEDDPELASRDTLFKRYVWVSGLEMAGDLWTRETLTKTQFNVRNNDLGDPTSSSKSAWALWLRDHQRLAQVDTITYRPGAPLFVTETWGRCMNIWRPSPHEPAKTATDDDVSPWVELLAYLYPEHVETIINWFAFVLQRPELKPNWHLVLGSTHHGVGKDLTLRPIVRAMGENNTRVITPDQLMSQYTDWAKGRKLIVVEEMQTYGRREMENRLKPYLASPPDTVPIRQVYMPVHEVPNICALVFFTNHENALPLSKQDRRHFVAWTDVAPRDAEYYVKMVKWQEAGGAAAVARWLLDRDLSKFDARGIAPMTSAKQQMQQQALSPLETWVEEGMLYGDGPFAPDIIDLTELCKRVPDHMDWKSATPERLGSLLRKNGATSLGRVRLPKPGATSGVSRAKLYSLRRHQMYYGLDHDKLVALYLKQQAEFQASEAFG